MRCPNTSCDGELRPGDSFCPKCGQRPAIQPVPTGPASTSPRPTPTTQHWGQRVSPSAVVDRTPHQEGVSYPSLRRLAGVLIGSGTFLKWVLFVLAGLLFIGVLLSPLPSLVWRVIAALLTGVLVAIGGWLLGLLLHVGGEIVYLVLDVEETFRRK